MRNTAIWCLCGLIVCGSFACAQDTTVTADVALVNTAKKSKPRKADNVVLWLTPVGGSTVSNFPPAANGNRPRLVQKNKSFEPHVLVVPVGASVEFPNRDPFFHNVFSLFEGKRFDLGLYEAGSTRFVQFDKPGISFIFCNIHAEMSAVVIALATPYYAISNAKGEVSLENVPPGRYQVEVFHSSVAPDALHAMAREITVG